MIRNVLEHMSGSGLAGAISTLIFFAVFLGALIVTVRLTRAHVRHMSALPLDDSKPDHASGD